MRRKDLFYYVTWGSNVTRDVHWCLTVFYQQIENSNIANQIHGFTIDYGKFILKLNRNMENMFSIYFRKHSNEKKENNLLTLLSRKCEFSLFTTSLLQQLVLVLSQLHYRNTIFNQWVGIFSWKTVFQLKVIYN